MNEREENYQHQIKELQSTMEQLRAEKSKVENELTQIINTMKDDHTRKYQQLQNEISDLNERG